MKLWLPLVFVLFGCGSGEGGVSGSTEASACGSCHTTEYRAWSHSRLASSGTSPVFAALSAKVNSTWGAAAYGRCVSCHMPGYGGDHGIGCVACHSATGNLASRDGLLTVDPSSPVSGPFADALPTPAHGSRAYGFLESPELCGTCHELTGPDLFRETTLSEFEASPAAKDGAGCVACHMPEDAAGPIAEGSTLSRPRRAHAFVALDPPWGAPPSVAKAAALRTLGLLRSGLGVVVSRAGTGFDVTMTNGSGHAIPTGITFLRRFWVDVELTDRTGRRTTLPSVLQLGSTPTRHGMPVALITEADSVESVVIPPGGTKAAHVEPPSWLEPPVRAVATLRGRAVTAETLSALGLDDRAEEVPVHQIATARD